MIRLAATLIIMRARRTGIEVLMARRTGEASFASGLWVFPGGGVDDIDGSALAAGLLGHAAQNREAAPFMSAALRETAEEINAFVTTQTPEPSLRARLGHLKGEPLLAALADAGLQFATADMAYWSNWLTPRIRPTRFDTRFFVVEVAPDLAFTPDQTEIVDVAWVAPAAALAGRNDRYKMMFPTIRNLTRLSDFTRPGDAIAHARASEVDVVEPAPILDDAGNIRKLLVPGDSGYEDLLARQVPHATANP